MTSEWKPIDSAPKDGVAFLAVCGDVVEKIAWFDGWGSGLVTKRNLPCWGVAYSDGNNINDEGWDEGTGCYLTPEYEPTLWQPLPEPPVK